ncbi:MAG: hypothetical protein IEMM0003_0954 [bacterium]|nr:MAG: hypothetical protein IEMM0003_0954 [bacterium]
MAKVIKVDCIGETCPIPLIEVRKAWIKVEKGDIIEAVGNHPASFKEIQMAAESLGSTIKEAVGGEQWKIVIEK